MVTAARAGVAAAWGRPATAMQPRTAVPVFSAPSSAVVAARSFPAARCVADGPARGFRSSSLSSSSSSSSSSGSGTLPDNDEGMAARIREAKAELVKMGYHGPSLWVQRICWGDHDQFQHVNNVHYVRFLESNRMFFAEKLAGKLAPARQRDIMRGSGQSFILQGISVRYRRPVVYPDTLLIGKKPVLPLGKDRFTLQAGVYSLAQQTMVATGEEVCVSYDYSALAKIDLPDDFRRALEAVAENPAE